MHNEIVTKLTQSKDTYANDAIELREHALWLLRTYEQDIQKKITTSTDVYGKSFDGNIDVVNAVNAYEVLAKRVKNEIAWITAFDRLKKRTDIITSLSKDIATTHQDVLHNISNRKPTSATTKHNTQWNIEKTTSVEKEKTISLLPNGVLDFDRFLGKDASRVSDESKFRLSSYIYKSFVACKTIWAWSKEPFLENDYNDIVTFDKSFSPFDYTLKRSEIPTNVLPDSQNLHLRVNINKNKLWWVQYLNQLRSTFESWKIDRFPRVLSSADVVDKTYLDTDGRLNRKTWPKRIAQILKPWGPKILTMHIYGSASINKPLYGEQTIIKNKEGRVFKHAPHMRVKILPGDKVYGYNDVFDKPLSQNIIQEMQDSKIDTMITNTINKDPLYQELSRRFTRTTLKRAMHYLLNNPNSKLKIWEQEHEFTPGWKFTIGMLKWLLETQRRYKHLTYPQLITKYQNNLNEYINMPDNFSKIFFVTASKRGWDDRNWAFNNVQDYRNILQWAYRQSRFDDLSAYSNSYRWSAHLIQSIVQYCATHPDEQVLCSLNLHGAQWWWLLYGPNHLITPQQIKQLGAIRNLTLDIDACFGKDQINPDAAQNDNTNLTSGENSATTWSTNALMKAYEKSRSGKAKWDFNDDGRVSHNEARIYQMLNYDDSLSYAVYQNDAGGYDAVADTGSTPSPQPSDAPDEDMNTWSQDASTMA